MTHNTKARNRMLGKGQNVGDALASPSCHAVKVGNLTHSGIWSKQVDSKFDDRCLTSNLKKGPEVGKRFGEKLFSEWGEMPPKNT